MAKKVAVYWPGDARAKPNELAVPSIEAATVQMERALKKLGRDPYRVPGFLSKPHEAIEKLGPIDDPTIGIGRDGRPDRRCRRCGDGREDAGLPGRDPPDLADDHGPARDPAAVDEPDVPGPDRA